jgi:hypothetical protein
MATVSPFVVFNPPILKISDLDFQTTFTMRLAQKPITYSVVYLNSAAGGLLFSQNTFNFTADNWNTVCTYYFLIIQHAEFSHTVLIYSHFQLQLLYLRVARLK